MRYLLTLGALCALTACSTTDESKATAAVATPLTDLNLVNAPIPEVLAKAQQGPYALPPNQIPTGVQPWAT
jgi:hypothetical protein